MSNLPRPGNLRLLLALLLTCTLPWLTFAAEPDAPADSAADVNRLQMILRQMPVNTDKRCVGIAGVAELLMASKPTPEVASAKQIAPLAEQIFSSFKNGEPVEVPAQLLIDGEPMAITQPAALRRMVTAVADTYKQSHAQLADTPEGVQQLIAAERQWVMSLEELDRLLAADADQLDFFCCFGRRRFPDGSEKQTSHAVLLRRNASGPPTVYDPNDPATPQQASFLETEQGLEVEWTCEYRDTGQITTQRYRIVPKSLYFRTAAAQPTQSPEQEPEDTTD